MGPSSKVNEAPVDPIVPPNIIESHGWHIVSAKHTKFSRYVEIPKTENFSMYIAIATLNRK